MSNPLFIPVHRATPKNDDDLTEDFDLGELFFIQPTLIRSFEIIRDQHKGHIIQTTYMSGKTLFLWLSADSMLQITGEEQ